MLSGLSLHIELVRNMAYCYIDHSGNWVKEVCHDYDA